jgi:hypothetical protein
MADVLIALIDEATSLPSELMDIIMAQFLDKNVVRKSILSLALPALFCAEGIIPHDPANGDARQLYIAH